MKTISQLKKEKLQLLKTGLHSSKEKRQLELITNAILYLETNPREEFMRSEVRRIEAIINSKKAGYGDYIINNSLTLDAKKQKSQFQSEMGFTEMRRKIKLIKYLLEE